MVRGPGVLVIFSNQLPAGKIMNMDCKIFRRFTCEYDREGALCGIGEDQEIGSHGQWLLHTDHEEGGIHNPRALVVETPLRTTSSDAPSLMRNFSSAGRSGWM